VRTPTAIGACAVGGTVVGCAVEMARVQYRAWRLGQLLEARHPEIFRDEAEGRSAADAILHGTRPWYWPEWVPFQPAAAPTREAVLKKEIESLLTELIDVEEAIAAASARLGGDGKPS